MATLVVLAPVAAMASCVVVAKELLHIAATEAARTLGVDRDEVVVATLDGKAVECGAGLTLAADRAIGDIDDCALVWVAGYWTELVAGARENAAVVPWLAARHAGGAELIGHGPGAFLIAEAGLLDGRLATTYRAQAGAFRQHHPEVDLQPQRAITEAGGIFCAVGLDSGRDLLVTLIERRYGPRIAASIAAWALNDSQRAYRSAASAFDGQRYHGDDEVLKIQDWLESNHREVLSIERLAQRFTMSTRTLTRRFRAATGDSPSEYLRRVRIEAAKDLLRNSHLTVAEVAVDVGYRDIGAFYDAFTKHTGQRPGAFRDAARVAPWDDTRKGDR
ncbi:MAG: helix-turn-helix domain-containing protein [Acidimicrobiales bacterium]|nr:helix-turn-helix domain-containing protein [Acidimicrobiales bacterium]